jgi:predicted deacetylase
MTNGPSYLVRFDDICPTMNWEMWEDIEAVLKHNKIKPIVAVVPDNRDPQLVVAEPRPDFWDRVRQWQDWGWTIALHGYRHEYVNHSAGMLGITTQSEFAGLSRAHQEAKLRAGLSIFHSQGIWTDTWIAPSHSFDTTTLELLKSLGIQIISDGVATRPFVDQYGLIWLPCQQWDRLCPKAAGVHTVCIHHNRWSRESMAAFRRDVETYHSRISSVSDVLESAAPSRLGSAERVNAWLQVAWKFRLRRAVKKVIRWH